MSLSKTKLIEAMQLAGFEDWRPAVDVPQLNRPKSRPAELEGNGRVAAVMLLLYASPTSDPKNGQAEGLKLVLTKRHSKLANHAGQISFPGGRQDKGESLWQTAVRETFEEIGVGGSQTNTVGQINNEKETCSDRTTKSTLGDPIEFLGQLNPVYIPPSDFTVSPFVAWFSGQPEFIRSEEEVDEIIEASVDHLLKPSVVKFGDIRSASGMNLDVPYFEVGPHRVWGATAIILGELIERIRRVVV